MSTITPILITLAVVSPLLALAVILRLWVQRHRQPGAARVRVLRCFFWFDVLLLLGFLALRIVYRGAGTATLADDLSVISSLLFVAAITPITIHACNQKLQRK
jgi:hypothetical protein